MKILTSKETAIQWYLDHGFTLFPLRGKVPLGGFHWREATFDPFFDPQDNFGVQLSAEDLVIDIDPRNGGTESFERLGVTTPTFTVETGSGGLHLYFKKPAGFKIRKNLKEFKGIDFISEGGYVVGAGSEHPKTNLDYFILKEGSIEKAPQALLDLIQKQDVVLEKGTRTYVEDEQTKQRYIEYLKQTDPAIEGEAGDARTFAVCAQGRDFGLSPTDVHTLFSDFYNIRCTPPWTEEAIKQKVENVFKYAKGSIGSKAPTIVFEIWTEEKIAKQKTEIDKYLQRGANGITIKPNLNNTAVIFNINFPNNALHNLLAFNEFSNNIEFLRSPPWNKVEPFIKDWSDEQAIQCKYWISNIWKFEPSTAVIHEAALKAAKDNSFHPVRDYLKDLKWDGHKRCHKWLFDIMGAQDNSYTRAVGLKFLVAAVKRIFEPGCKYDYILTLEGRQGTFKSTVFEILSVRKEWYGDPHIDIMNKDSVVLLFGKWIVEMPEMQTHYRAETTAMKGFLSRSVDRSRMAYGRVAKDYPRQCVFGGTINHEADRDFGWLKDTTGNRRYWPVLVGEIRLPNLTGLREVVHQLWAEAYQLYLSGVPVYLEDIAILKQAEDEQAKRLGKDPWQDTIENWLDAPNNIGVNVFNGEEIYEFCLGGNMEKYSGREARRISHVMDNLRWVKGIFWDKDKRKPKRGYKRPEVIDELR